MVERTVRQAGPVRAVHRSVQRGAARQWVLACVDDSPYANSVSDHAGWFASHPEVGVDVLHVVEGSTTPVRDSQVEHALSRLRDAGVGPLAGAARAGDFVDVLTDTDADILVLGKRGSDSGEERRSLGSNVDAAVRRCAKPICLAPKVFLPIHRALVLLDADLDHRAALEFVVDDFRLAALPLDVAVVAKPGDDADAKVEWARRTLSAVKADVFPLFADGLDGAMTQYVPSRAADLIVLSRAVVAPDPQTQLRHIEEGGLWSTRAPVLIC